MIVWSGFGFMIAVIGIGSLIITELIAELITSNEDFYQNNSWLIFIGMIIAAIITINFNKLIKNKENDHDDEHSLFFIPVKWWPGIFVVIGIICTFAMAKSETEKIEIEITKHCNNGHSKYQSGQYKEAIEDFNKAIKLDPRCYDAYLGCGYSKENSGQYKEAIKDFNKAVKLNPKNFEAYLGRGFSKRNLRQYKAAIKDFDKAIKLNPQYAVAYNNRGYSKDCLRQHREAIKDYDKAIKLNPKYVIAYGNRGYAKYCLEQYEEAIKDLNKAIESNPKNVLVYNDLYNANYKLGNYKEARKNILKAKELAIAQKNTEALKFITNNINELNKTEDKAKKIKKLSTNFTN